MLAEIACLHEFQKCKIRVREELHVRIRGQIISVSHCVLCGLPIRTFVHSLQNIAFRSYRRAGRDNATHTLTGNIFTMYSRAGR